MKCYHIEQLIEIILKTIEAPNRKNKFDEKKRFESKSTIFNVLKSGKKKAFSTVKKVKRSGSQQINYQLKF